jgi:methionyl-tRNA formyltransferase
MATFPTTPLDRPLRIAFLGTPEFAAVCLEALAESSHELAGVVTAPDRPAGRGHRMQASAVKTIAEKRGFPILQPTNLKSTEFLEAFANWHVDVAIVVAFRMLPEIVWKSPPFGTINLHASLLPNLRGAAPIHRAIMAGLKETGVTTFSLEHAIDTGDILLQDSTDIAPHENTGALHDRLADLGKALIVQTLDTLVTGNLAGVPQNVTHSTEDILDAPKLFKSDCKIDWNLPCKTVLNHIRGLAPFPKAWCASPWGDLKILEATEHKGLETSRLIGIAIAHQNKLVVACQDGWIQISHLVAPGKRPMSGSEWLNGLGDREPGNWGPQPE